MAAGISSRVDAWHLGCSNQKRRPCHRFLSTRNVKGSPICVFEISLFDIVNDTDDFHRRLRCPVIVDLFSDGILVREVAFCERAIDDRNQGLRRIVGRSKATTFP